jgi:hypothetical protein
MLVLAKASRSGPASKRQAGLTSDYYLYTVVYFLYTGA